MLLLTLLSHCFSFGFFLCGYVIDCSFLEDFFPEVALEPEAESSTNQRQCSHLKL